MKKQIGFLILAVALFNGLAMAAKLPRVYKITGYYNGTMSSNFNPEPLVTATIKGTISVFEDRSAEFNIIGTVHDILRYERYNGVYEPTTPVSRDSHAQFSIRGRFPNFGGDTVLAYTITQGTTINRVFLDDGSVVNFQLGDCRLLITESSLRTEFGFVGRVQDIGTYVPLPIGDQMNLTLELVNPRTVAQEISVR